MGEDSDDPESVWAHVLWQRRGLRMEDVVRITKDGFENLTNYPKELFEL